MKKDEIAVIVCEPNRDAYRATVLTGYRSFRDEVGGYYQEFPLSKHIWLICNEAGRTRFAPCRFANLYRGTQWSIIFGRFFFCAKDKEKRFVSLNEEQAEWVLKNYAPAEQFAKGRGGSYLAEKFETHKNQRKR